MKLLQSGDQEILRAFHASTLYGAVQRETNHHRDHLSIVSACGDGILCNGCKVRFDRPEGIFVALTSVQRSGGWRTDIQHPLFPKVLGDVGRHRADFRDGLLQPLW